MERSSSFQAETSSYLTLSVWLHGTVGQEQLNQ